MLKENKKANGWIVFILIMIILVSLVFIVLLYMDIDLNDIEGKFYGLPDYKFNDKSIVFIDETTFNKMQYAYENIEDGEKLCLYGIEKNNGDILINSIDETSSYGSCNDVEEFIGLLYINKNHIKDIYDINCGLDKDQIDKLNINDNIITGIMCKNTWFGFYNNESIDTSYEYQIV